MRLRGFELAAEYGVADHGVEQHQREDEETLAPEHEGEARIRRGGLVDRDRERDHVGPERDRERSKSGCENQRTHVKGHTVLIATKSARSHERGNSAARRKGETIRTLEPRIADP